VYLDFHLRKEPPDVNDGFQTVSQRAAWEIPREVNGGLYSDFQPNLPVSRLPL
jgi:hypothetical protein